MADRLPRFLNRFENAIRVGETFRRGVKVTLMKKSMRREIFFSPPSKRSSEIRADVQTPAISGRKDMQRIITEEMPDIKRRRFAAPDG